VKRRRILLLVHPQLIPPEDIDGLSEKEIDVFRCEYNVYSNLRNLGHEVRVLGVLDSVTELRKVVKEWQPHVAFNLLQEFSIPLLSGVFVALLVANLAPEAYHRILAWEPVAGLSLFDHTLDFHFLVNDVFMVFFFGIAAKEITEPQQLLDGLQAEMSARLAGSDRSLRFEPAPDGAEGSPNIWMFVGVNGVGKTTTIGKVARQQTDAGRSVLLAAGDTFRAAAAEQLGTWAERSGTEFVRGAEGGDPSSVIFDGVERAASKGIDLVLADTAGTVLANILIRTLLWRARAELGENVAEVSYRVGGGITWGSDALAEDQESLAKGEALARTLEGEA